ncbi:hypothetical protein SLA2020_514880 [Shorea laevis]
MEVRGQDKEMGMPRRRDQSVVSDAVLPQSLDHHHHHHHPVHHHQVNPHINKARRNPEPDPNPVPAPAATPAANRSSRKSPQRAPTPPRPSPAPPAATSAPLVRYRECLKNHAAATGGHVLDGCGEFMPCGEEGTLEALKCAACDCHRSFHRKEINGESQYTPNSYYTYTPNKNSARESIHPLPQHRLPHGFSISAPSTVPIAPVMMTFGGGNGGGPAESSSEDLIVCQANAAGQSSVQLPSSKKRFRTKFNQEQKDKMMEFAEKLGWKIQKQDEEEVQQFCAQVGVKRQVFKVWMHNNKQAMKKMQM